MCVMTSSMFHFKGYRPILDAMKSFVSDPMKKSDVDIEVGYNIIYNMYH